MGKKILLGIILAVVIFHAVWYAGSRIYQNRKLPDTKTIKAYNDSMIKRMKMNIDTTSIEEKFIDANGFKIHMIIGAVGKNAPTLIFIPGTTVYAEIYAELIYKMYKQGFNVIGFDPRGHGQSGGPRGDYTINGIVDDALAVAKYARNRFSDKVVIVGSSQGGMAAFYAAAREDSITAVVCHNIADLNGKDNLVLSQVKPPQFLVPVCTFIMNLYGSYSFPVSLYLDLTKEKLKDGTPIATMIKTDPLAVTWITFRALNSLLHTDLAKPVEKITVPVMLIHAGRDNIFPQSYVESIYNRLTCKKKYLLLKNTEHLVMTNNVDEVVPPVTAWLKEVMH